MADLGGELAFVPLTVEWLVAIAAVGRPIGCE